MRDHRSLRFRFLAGRTHAFVAPSITLSLRCSARVLFSVAVSGALFMEGFGVLRRFYNLAVLLQPIYRLLSGTAAHGFFSGHSDSPPRLSAIYPAAFGPFGRGTPRRSGGILPRARAASCAAAARGL